MKIFFIISISLFIFISFKIIRNQIINKRRNQINNSLNANYFIETINNLIEENKYNLLEERIRLKNNDAYGNEDIRRWIGSPPLEEKTILKNIASGSNRFKEGIPYFWEKVILRKFEGQKSFFEKWDNYKKGIRFENHCMEILKHNGWNVKRTPNTGDQGVDLIASIENLRISIQCKNHNKAVGNKAVQEISAGKLYWKCTHAILVSNSGFTKSAYKLAKENKVKLINEYELINLGNIVLK